MFGDFGDDDKNTIETTAVTLPSDVNASAPAHGQTMDDLSLVKQEEAAIAAKLADTAAKITAAQEQLGINKVQDAAVGAGIPKPLVYAAGGYLAYRVVRNNAKIAMGLGLAYLLFKHLSNKSDATGAQTLNSVGYAHWAR